MQFTSLIRDSRAVIKQLISQRLQQGLTAQAVAKRMCCAIWVVSRLEARTDDAIPLGDLRDYAEAVGLTVTITLTPKEGSGERPTAT